MTEIDKAVLLLSGVAESAGVLMLLVLREWRRIETVDVKGGCAARAADGIWRWFAGTEPVYVIVRDLNLQPAGLNETSGGSPRRPDLH